MGPACGEMSGPLLARGLTLELTRFGSPPRGTCRHHHVCAFLLIRSQLSLRPLPSCCPTPWCCPPHWVGSLPQTQGPLGRALSVPGLFPGQLFPGLSSPQGTVSCFGPAGPQCWGTLSPRSAGSAPQGSAHALVYVCSRSGSPGFQGVGVPVPRVGEGASTKNTARGPLTARGCQPVTWDAFCQETSRRESRLGLGRRPGGSRLHPSGRQGVPRISRSCCGQKTSSLVVKF